jgi:response regulator RpfG family c-di-GMP phosphodiesterase
VQRLLIVDQSTSTRNRLREGLTDSFEILEAENAPAALSLALDHRPDGILLDLDLPSMSGVELWQALRSVTYTSHIPIFVITAGNGPKFGGNHLQLSVNGIFRKPIDVNEIANQLARDLNAPPRPRRAHVRIRMRTILKLRGTDARGHDFDELTATENVSAGGFLCNSTTTLEEGAVVEVSLVAEEERYAGRARLAHKEDFVGPWQRYGFQFEEKTKVWILYE